MKFSPLRDIVGGLVGAFSGGVGLVGVAAKKLFVAADDSFTKKFLIGLAATVLTGGAALLPYLLTGPGQETRAELAAARSSIVDDRYSGGE
ncbi:MAG: hypothetical protein A2138_27735 [Deltaproteobacteria bacterium RBG_16_71_12]|nr:MAG: hypothetical protein A2138_27735 [Deltaproteobacteria bacterium RBG_16_71_12]